MLTGFFMFYTFYENDVIVSDGAAMHYIQQEPNK
jgi:hypothetical protein